MADTEDRVALILGLAASQLDPITYVEERKKAASKLIEDFLMLAESKGFRRDTGHGAPRFAYDEKKPHVRLLVDEHSGEIEVRVDIGKDSLQPVPVPLDFNAADGALVGTTIDHEVTTAPGHVPPRLPALVVLARAVTKLLDPKNDE